MRDAQTPHRWSPDTMSRERRLTIDRGHVGVTHATKSLREYLDEYGEGHRHFGTRLTHMFGIPMIVASLPLFPFNPLVGGGLFVGGWILQFIGLVRIFNMCRILRRGRADNLQSLCQR